MASYEQRGKNTRAVVRLPGGGKTSKTFDTKAKAEQWAEEKERTKAISSAPSGSNPTVGEMLEEYLPIAKATDSGKWNEYRIMNWLNDPIAKLRLHDVTTHEINGWIDRRSTVISQQTKKPLKSSTINRELNLMSGAFTYAVDTRRWIAINPCHGCNRPEKGRPRKRVLLTPLEIEALCISTGYSMDPLLGTLTARVGACFLFALETGMRSGEILRMRPQDYWKDRRIMYVHATERGGRKASKSGRSSVDPSRQVPLTARAMEIADQLLATMPEGQEPCEGFSQPPYIVGLNDSQRDALWRKARDQAGVQDLTYHDTKHEAATKLARFLDVLALSHAIGTKDVRLLRDTYYNNDAERSAALLPAQLATMRQTAS